MNEILRLIVDLADRGERGALASIVSAKGSLPMSRRSRMLVLADGTQHGTVGGGCLEAEVHALGRQVLKSGGALVGRFTLTETKAGAEGLNCGGTVEILIETVGSGEAGTGLFRMAREAIDAGEETVMATLTAPVAAAQGGLPSDRVPHLILGKTLVGWHGARAGAGLLAESSELSAFVVEEALAILGQDRAAFVRLPEKLGAHGERAFLETLSAPPTLYLFGGGHVSLSVARVARTAGFKVVVVDDRPAFANPERFPEADESRVLPMATAVAALPIDRTSYIVAVTRGHQHDEPVIEQAIRTPAAYIGMIGSKRKVALMWRRLRERGASESELARVHAPIGLPIGADTPGEIAVSIVAQLVEVRRLRKS